MLFGRIADDVSITWDNGVVSQYSSDWLREHEYWPAPPPEVCRPKYVLSREVPSSFRYLKDHPADVPEVEYGAILEDPDAVFEWLYALNAYGICIVSGLPDKEGEVVRLAEHVAPVQSTIYGKHFDVVAEPEPVNIAYSTAHLDLHMDL